MSEHQLGNHSYIIGKLNVRQQFEVTCSLGLMSLLLEREVEPDHVDGARFLGALVSGDLATIPKADRDTIFNTCLSAVRVVREGRAVPAFNAATGLPMFEDVGIDMPLMLELVDLVIQENLGPFFEKLRGDRDKRLAALQNQSGEISNP